MVNQYVTKITVNPELPDGGIEFPPIQLPSWLISKNTNLHACF
jgi:hypothetical protein